MPSGIVNERMVFSYLTLPHIGEPVNETIIVEASQTESRETLTQKIAALIAERLGYDDPSALESHIQLSHRGLILGQNECNTIQDLRNIQNHELAGKSRTTALVIKIHP